VTQKDYGILETFIAGCDVTFQTRRYLIFSIYGSEKKEKGGKTLWVNQLEILISRRSNLFECDFKLFQLFELFAYVHFNVVFLE